MAEVRPPVRCCRKSKGRRRLSRQPHGRGMNGLQSYRIGRPVNRPAQVKRITSQTFYPLRYPTLLLSHIDLCNVCKLTLFLQDSLTLYA